LLTVQSSAQPYYLDQQRDGLPQPQAGNQDAIAAMRDRELTDSYVEAFDEWTASGEAELWDVTVADGLDDDAEPGDPS
jgi:hypothetical protein